MVTKLSGMTGEVFFRHVDETAECDHPSLPGAMKKNNHQLPTVTTECMDLHPSRRLDGNGRQIGCGQWATEPENCRSQ